MYRHAAKYLFKGVVALVERELRKDLEGALEKIETAAPYEARPRYNPSAHAFVARVVCSAAIDGMTISARLPSKRRSAFYPTRGG